MDAAVKTLLARLNQVGPRSVKWHGGFSGCRRGV